MPRLPDARPVATADVYTEAEHKTSAIYNEHMGWGHRRDNLNARLDGRAGAHRGRSARLAVRTPLLSGGRTAYRTAQARCFERGILRWHADCLDCRVPRPVCGARSDFSGRGPLVRSWLV